MASPPASGKALTSSTSTMRKSLPMPCSFVKCRSPTRFLLDPGGADHQPTGCRRCGLGDAALRLAGISRLTRPERVCYFAGFASRKRKQDFRKERKLWQASKPEVLYAVPTR